MGARKRIIMICWQKYSIQTASWTLSPVFKAEDLEIFRIGLKEKAADKGYAP